MKKMLFKVCLITLLILCNLSVYSTTCMADGSLDDVMNNGNSFLNAGSESSTMIDQNDLKSLGIKNVFEPSHASLINLTSNKGASISEVMHKANIEFSNEGIKAAAATEGGGAGDTNCGFDYIYKVPIKEIDITFNKPFMFLIRDKNTKEVWFAGTVYEPTEYSEKGSC